MTAPAELPPPRDTYCGKGPTDPQQEDKPLALACMFCPTKESATYWRRTKVERAT